MPTVAGKKYAYTAKGKAAAKAAKKKKKKSDQSKQSVKRRSRSGRIPGKRGDAHYSSKRYA
jgi:hypothetical protein